MEFVLTDREEKRLSTWEPLVNENMLVVWSPRFWAAAPAAVSSLQHVFYKAVALEW